MVNCERTCLVVAQLQCILHTSSHKRLLVYCPDVVQLASQAEQDAAEAEYDSNAQSEGMSEAKKACLIYRSSQKRIAREYLIRARQELDNELNRMQKLQHQD